MENCCDSLIKYIIFVFNFFFFIAGIALISVGAYMKAQMSNYLNFLDDTYLNTSMLFIILGVVIVLIGFFGCCGACTENSCMMFTFATLLAIVVVVQIAAAIAIYVYKGDAKTAITDKMKDGMKHYDPESEEYKGVTTTWDQIQADLQCCGVKSYKDWGNTSFSQSSGDVPDDCCKSHAKGCGKGVLNDPTLVDNIYTDGCFQKLETLVEENVEVVGGVAIGFVLLQFVGVLVSCMLACNMRRRSNYV